MFNSYNIPQTVNINAVSGTIVKNYKDSFILRFNMKSDMAYTLLDKNPRLKKYRDYEPVVVLQIMLCGEQELLAEVMWKEDFDKMYEPQESEAPNADSEENSKMLICPECGLDVHSDYKTCPRCGAKVRIANDE